MLNNKKRVIAVPCDFWACGQYRIIQPYRDMALRYNPLTNLDFRLLLPKENSKINIQPLFEDNVKVIIFQRIITENILELVKKLKKAGKIVIMEVDDDVFNVDTRNPFHIAMKGQPYKKVFINALKTVDYVHVTNQHLKDIYSLSIDKDKIFIFPNVIDLSHPLYSKSRRNELPLDKIIIGWQGGSSHTIDLKNINFISDLLSSYSNVDFAICTNKQMAIDLFGSYKKKFSNRFHILEPITTKFDDFPSLPSMFDIGLAPLELNKFNNSKSWLKVLEHGVYSSPTICSNTFDYSNFNINYGGNVIVEKNEKDLWLQKIDYLLKDNNYKKYGLKTRQVIDTSLNLKQINKERFMFYNRILNNA